MKPIKSLCAWIKKQYTLPTPAELIASELLHAQRAKLRHQTAMEYHTAIVAYNVARVKRLEVLTTKQEVVE